MLRSSSRVWCACRWPCSVSPASSGSQLASAGSSAGGRSDPAHRSGSGRVADEGPVLPQLRAAGAGRGTGRIPAGPDSRATPAAGGRLVGASPGAGGRPGRQRARLAMAALMSASTGMAGRPYRPSLTGYQASIRRRAHDRRSVVVRSAVVSLVRRLANRTGSDRSAIFGKSIGLPVSYLSKRNGHGVELPARLHQAIHPV